MPVNPTIRDILEAMGNQAAAAHEDAVLTQAKLDDLVAVANDTLLQATLTASYTGDIRETALGIEAKVDISLGLQQQAVDRLQDILALLDVMNTNAAANWSALLTLLELMNNNASANAQAIIAAVCGDCPPPVDPGADFDCWIYQNTSQGPDGEQGLPFDSGPGFGPFNAGEGFSVHWRGNEFLEDTRIYVHQTVPDEASVLLATLDSVGDFYAGVWNGDPITVSASEWIAFPKNQFSVWVCPDGVEPPE